MIRRAGPHDIAALAALCAAHARFERAPADTVPDAAGLLAGLSGPSPELVAWVAVQAGGIVGYASGYAGFCTWHGRRMFHLDCLYLDEACRGRGLGRALMDAVAGFAAGHGCGHLEWVTPPWNTRAIRFYQRLGASMQPRQRFRLGTAAAPAIPPVPAPGPGNRS